MAPIRPRNPNPFFESGNGVFSGTKHFELGSSSRGTRKRPASPSTANKRIRPTPTTITPLRVTNVSQDETIYQRCVVVKGECHSFEDSDEDYVSVNVKHALNGSYGPQHWPVAGGLWKALIMLEPGKNELTFQHHHAGGISGKADLTTTYTVLTQTPPVHLAILVASDSPLLIECPASKYGAISSAHSGLDAAVAKFRMTAYMWQAALAERSREQGLGRRSFRLEEEWTFNTIMRNGSGPSELPSMNSVARVHIVRSCKPVAQLKSTNNFDDFLDALEAQGGPFCTGTKSVVAGMVLDASSASGEALFSSYESQYNPHEDAHIQLVTFPSHCVYSWPRFVEEVTSSLLDPTVAQKSSAHQNNACLDCQDTHGVICQATQGRSLTSAMRALGVSESASKCGEDVSWSNEFLANGSTGIKMPSEVAQRSLQCALQLRRAPQAQLPGDSPDLMDTKLGDAKLEVHFEEMVDSDQEEEDDDDNHKDEDTISYYQLTVRCEAALSKITIQYSPTNILQTEDLIDEYHLDTIKEFSFIIPSSSLVSEAGPLSAHVLTGNGLLRTIHLTNYLQNRSHLSIPNSRVRLNKIGSHPGPISPTLVDSQSPDEGTAPWAMLLARRNDSTKTLSRAKNIDLRVGCTFDGIVVRYADSTRADNRPTEPQPHHFGGHASQNKDLPSGSRIVRVEVFRPYGAEGSLDGIRITLDSGETWGELNDRYGRRRGEEDSGIVTLEPEKGQEVVGFFGRSDRNGCGFVREFGILTAAVGVEKLPEGVWGMEEFKQGQGDKTAGQDEGDEEWESDGTQC